MRPFLLLFIGLFLSCSEKYPGRIITLPAVPYDRLAAPVYLDISNLSKDSSYVLVSGEDSLDLQAISGDHYVFILPFAVPAGTEKHFHLASMKLNRTTPVSMDTTDGVLTASVRGRDVLKYAMEIQQPPEGKPAYYQRSGFIHPAYSPAGKVLTDGFPAGHTHQHGIFFAWVNTLFEGRNTDFWNQHHQTGTVMFDTLRQVCTGPVFARFLSHQTYVALSEDDSTNVLSEQWDVRVYNLDDYFMWDLTVHQENKSDSSLVIEPYHYGGMAVRGSSEWNDTTASEGKLLTGKGQGGFITSESKTRLTGNHTRPDWAALFGNIGDNPVSISLIQHPDNFGYPQYVRIHPAMPYFCFLPVIREGITLLPGETYWSAYRIITTDSLPDPVQLDRFTRQFQDNFKPF